MRPDMYSSLGETKKALVLLCIIFTLIIGAWGIKLGVEKVFPKEPPVVVATNNGYLSHTLAEMCPSYIKLQYGCERELRDRGVSPADVAKQCTAPKYDEICSTLLQAGASQPGMDARLSAMIGEGEAYKKAQEMAELTKAQ